MNDELREQLDDARRGPRRTRGEFGTGWPWPTTFIGDRCPAPQEIWSPVLWVPYYRCVKGRPDQACPDCRCVRVTR